MSFAQQVIGWQRMHGRHDLPWQGTRDPYRIWLSEVMLQQTQVSAVIPYYQRFLSRYPTAEALAAASEDEVLQLWSGLGYYARGRNLHKAAAEIARHGFPKTADKIAELPGVGRSTAAAIAAFAYGERAAILDGNVKRVLSRVFGVSEKQDLWKRAERALPQRDIETYTQGLMDLGATVCKRVPDCGMCPVKARCVARKTGRIAELPAARAKKALPWRQASWFVFFQEGKVLLERRPSPGIWGGLWCFPEQRPAGCRVKAKLAVIEHGFTHFKLRIQPLLCVGVTRKSGFWMDLHDAGRAAIPAPVRNLLHALAGNRHATRR
ncbi:MAG TPA: A/G-specific adenine glycosylase [Burkholderiales bacterium]|nr:A/G-specific adenine glycosylase [Burkholderiales bacterium]